MDILHLSSLKAWRQLPSETAMRLSNYIHELNKSALHQFPDLWVNKAAFYFGITNAWKRLSYKYLALTKFFIS